MRFTNIILAGLIALGGLWTSDTYAAEKRCDALGQNCVCSEPLQASSYMNYGPSYYNPSDSTTKECTADYFDNSFKGYAVLASWPGAVIAGSDPAVLARLPSGHQVTHYIRGLNNDASDWNVRHAQWSPNSRTEAAAVLPGIAGPRNEYIAIKRVAMRFYVYHSPDYDFVGDNGGRCTNGKWGGVDNLTHSRGGSGAPNSIYNFAWGPWTADGPGGNQFLGDCCNVGPWRNGENPSPLNLSGQALTGRQAYNGKWWRVEVVETNRLGGLSPNGFRLQIFIRNITDDWPEQRISDTENASSTPGFTPSASLTPGEVGPTGFFDLHFAAWLYRAPDFVNPQPGDCRGWAAISHFMVAQWDTDTGQRIGAASEIEGGGGPSQSLGPTSPTNLRPR
jgi:hypothetical protein